MVLESSDGLRCGRPSGDMGADPVEVKLQLPAADSCFENGFGEKLSGLRASFDFGKPFVINDPNFAELTALGWGVNVGVDGRETGCCLFNGGGAESGVRGSSCEACTASTLIVSREATAVEREDGGCASGGVPTVSFGSFEKLNEDCREPDAFDSSVVWDDVGVLSGNMEGTPYPL